MVMDINDHYEQMDHEIKRVTTPINRFGYKIDGQKGIKQRCGLDKLKSADYIDDKEIKIAFVEFSDIARQYHRLLGEVEIVKNLAKLNKGKESRICNDMCTSNIDSVQAEVMQKFKDSLHIFAEMKLKYKNLPTSFNLKPHAILVIAPISDEDKPCRKEDISRLLDQLSNRVRMNLPEELISSFRLLDISNFASP
jgi:hypothetical protein